MKTALILSTYPIKKPYHGGQHRLMELAKAYRSAGLEVITVAVYEPESYGNQEVDFTDIAFPSDSPMRFFKGKSIPFISDLMAGDYLVEDKRAWEQLESIINKNEISLIHFEHPWLLPAVKKINLLLARKNPLIVFGSANIESKLKKEIFTQYDLLKKSFVQDVLKLIQDREIEAANFADVTLVVTKEDESWFETYAEKSNLMLVQNGVRHLTCNNKKIAAVKEKIRSEKWMTYVASAHPPNFNGFYQCVGDSLASIPPDGKLILAGSVSDHLEPYLKSSRMRFLNDSRLITFGRVESDVLDTIVLNSHGILLPITTGGGSNLKTAEALVSNQHIVGTTKAFRGYESFLDMNGVIVADSKNEFRVSIRKIFNLPKLSRSSSEASRVSQLYWENILVSLIEYVQERLL